MDRVRDGIRSSKGCLAFTELPEYVVYNEEPISQGHETCSKKTCYCAAQTPPGNKKEEEEKWEGEGEEEKEEEGEGEEVEEESESEDDDEEEN